MATTSTKLSTTPTSSVNGIDKSGGEQKYRGGVVEVQRLSIKAELPPDIYTY